MTSRVYPVMVPVTVAASTAPGECSNGELHTRAPRCREESPEVVECPSGCRSGAVIREKPSCQLRHVGQGRRFEQAVDVTCILVDKTPRRRQPLVELVCFGDHQGGRAGDVHRHSTRVGGFERRDIDEVVMEERSFDSGVLARSGPSVAAR